MMMDTLIVFLLVKRHVFLFVKGHFLFYFVFVRLIVFIGSDSLLCCAAMKVEFDYITMRILRYCFGAIAAPLILTVTSISLFG